MPAPPAYQAMLAASGAGKVRGERATEPKLGGELVSVGDDDNIDCYALGQRRLDKAPGFADYGAALTLGWGPLQCMNLCDLGEGSLQRRVWADDVRDARRLRFDNQPWTPPRHQPTRAS